MTKVFAAKATTNAYVPSQLLTWNREHKQIIFLIKNVGANGLKYKIMAKMVGGNDQMLKVETTLAAAVEASPETLTDRWDLVWLEVKSAADNSHTTCDGWIEGTKS